jgi:hypothetical protein
MRALVIVGLLGCGGKPAPSPPANQAQQGAPDLCPTLMAKDVDGATAIVRAALARVSARDATDALMGLLRLQPCIKDPEAESAVIDTEPAIRVVHFIVPLDGSSSYRCDGELRIVAHGAFKMACKMLIDI